MYKLVREDDTKSLPNGFFLDGVSAGLKPANALDLAFIYSETACETAALFTTNKMVAAPIKHFKNKGSFQTNFVLINSKNANAMTGEEGVKDIDEILNALPFEGILNPLMSSTGVIGVRLPKEKIISGCQKLDLLKKEPQRASEAIMTTDTFAKRIAFRVELEDNKSFTIWAMAKGAGMINPAMATMLCFILTDADVEQNEMQEMLDSSIETTFNAVSVDGDTSTNDTVLLLSNKTSGAYHQEAFLEALHKVMRHLSLEIIRDGEGATKVVEYSITGAKNDTEAQITAKKLSNSLLVKTALFGEDPNWGRIASTIGASGVTCQEELLTVAFGGIRVYDRGVINFDKEMEAKAAEVMRKSSFTIHCDLGIGKGSFNAYGCDLGHEYVKINADYRT
jgi:glutamate N-acetyltransferase / amino-acid N-acetyltransferase